MSIPAAVAEFVDKPALAVPAVHLPRRDAFDAFEQLIEIGVIGEGHRVIDARFETVLWVQAPARDGDCEAIGWQGGAAPAMARRGEDEHFGPRVAALPWRFKRVSGRT